jgi:hypothetical protein
MANVLRLSFTLGKQTSLFTKGKAWSHKHLQLLGCSKETRKVII